MRSARIQERDNFLSHFIITSKFATTTGFVLLKFLIIPFLYAQ